MNMWLMYLIMQLDNIQILLGIAGWLGILLLIGWRIAIPIIYDDRYCDEDEAKKYKQQCSLLKHLYFVPILMALTATLMPDTRGAAVLYVLPKVIHNTNAKKIPTKLMTLANAWMDTEIKTIKGEI